MTEATEEETPPVYLVEHDGTMFLAATPEAAKRHAEREASDYFGRPVLWTESKDGTEFWEGKYYDGPNRNGRITITGMEVMQ